MLLYDVFYTGNCFDSCIPLPKPTKDMLYATCVNGPYEILVPDEKEAIWRSATRDEEQDLLEQSR